MILNISVKIKINNFCIKHYRDLGYVVKEYDIIDVPVEHLMKTSHQTINVKCDVCGMEKKIQYRRYLLSFNNGGYYCCSICQKIKMKNFLRNNFGIENIFQKEEIKEKIKKTNIKKYGNESFLRSDSEKFVLDKYSYLNMLGVDYDKDEYILICDRCNSSYSINKKNFIMRLNKYKTILCTKCNPIDRHISGQEIQLQDFIKTIYDGETTYNSRKVIPPLELDIFLPKLNLAFEFNGTYWHSKDFKGINYHNNKTEKCEEKNINLIHVSESDWTKNREFIKYEISKIFEKITF